MRVVSGQSRHVSLLPKTPVSWNHTSEKDGQLLMEAGA